MDSVNNKSFLCFKHGGSSGCAEKNRQLRLQCPKCQSEADQAEDRLQSRRDALPGVLPDGSPYECPDINDPAVMEALRTFDVFPGKDYGPITFDHLTEDQQAGLLVMSQKLDSLNFEEYQAAAKKTAIYNQDARVLYPSLGLVGEVGEIIEKVLQMAAHAGQVANQVKKIIRDDDCECDTPRKHAIGKEIGGVIWYCADLATCLGLNLGDIAQENLGVLASRQERGVIQGDGDER